LIAVNAAGLKLVFPVRAVAGLPGTALTPRKTTIEAMMSVRSEIPARLRR
jgi:hypothetical protein